MKLTDSKSNESVSLIANSNSDIVKGSIEVGTAAIGTLVGLAIGGPVGAVVGGVTSPAISLAHDIIANALNRRQKRLEEIVTNSIAISGMNVDDTLQMLNNNDNKTDVLLSLLSLAVSSDESLDYVFSGLISEMLKSPTQQEDRIIIIGDAIRNFRAIHLKIISAIYSAGGTLSASEISSAVNVPEIELRSVVRDLELRGIILDLQKHPVEWELRELGQAIANYIQNRKGNE